VFLLQSEGDDGDWGEQKTSSGGLFRQRSGQLPGVTQSKPSGGANLSALNDFDDDDSEDGFNPAAFLNKGPSVATKPASKPLHHDDEDEEDMIDTPKIQQRHALGAGHHSSHVTSTSVDSDEFSMAEGDSGEFDMN